MIVFEDMSSTKKEDIQSLKDKIVLAKSNNDTKLVRMLEKILARIIKQ